MRLRVLLSIGISLVALGVPVAVAGATPTTVRSGMEIGIDDTLLTTNNCTLGAVISRTKALTAGHCGAVGRPVRDRHGTRIGTVTANRVARDLDIAVIRLAPRAVIRVDDVNWNPRFFRGQPVTKVGVATGFGKGKVTDPSLVKRTSAGFSLAPPFVTVHDSYSIQTSLHSQLGDSGAGVRDTRGQVVGILSSGTADGTIVVPLSKVPRSLR
ncbi:trypsin-like peptidase domain-containing protein [Gordonia aurantiaca]|uniref:trypsin-like peptidase domain-containing protein n=1 Tax=Gordonia sp. B21 TaxID=3151852 RepID=UPI0032666B10